jgi:hypothetical protein
MHTSTLQVERFCLNSTALPAITMDKIVADKWWPKSTSDEYIDLWNLGFEFDSKNGGATRSRTSQHNKKMLATATQGHST